MNFKILFIYFVSYIITIPISAQPSIEWQKSLGGSGVDKAASIQQTSDGGYIIAGMANSNDGDITGNHGAGDFWIVKLSNSGSIEWQESIGGSKGENANIIQQTNDGGYIVAGDSYSNDGDVSSNNGKSDYWVVKLSKFGAITWQKSLGGSSFEWLQSVLQTVDGGYIVAGITKSNDGDVSGNHGNEDVWIVKLNNNGVIEWQKCYGGKGNDKAFSIQSTKDGGYIIGGGSNSKDGDVTGHHGNNSFLDYWVIKLTSQGAITWQKSLGGTLDDLAFSIQQTTDGGFIVAGNSKSNDSDVSGNHGYFDYWIVKLTDTGAISWQHALGGTGFDIATSIQQTSEGGFIVSGYSNSIDGDVIGNQGNNDYWVVKLNNNGVIEWQKCLGGTDEDWANSVQQTLDGGYILAGWSKSINGDVTGNHGDYDYWVVKISSLVGFENDQVETKINVYPNPFNNQLIVENSEFSTGKLTLYNNLGSFLLKKDIFGNEIIDTTNLPSGMYFYKVSNKNSVVKTGTLMKL
jgi:Secretion system C-terminal sorting domain